MTSDAPGTSDSHHFSQNGNVDGNGLVEGPEVRDGPNPPPEIAPLQDPRLPTRKDTSLREFLNKIDDYAPIVKLSPLVFPFLDDSLTSHRYLTPSRITI